jgi:hypothetical protein
MVITENYKNGLQFLKENKMDEARDCFDFALSHLAIETLENDLTDNDELEGIRRGLWLERLWYALENNDLLYE